jgi:hypothetical protein
MLTAQGSLQASPGRFRWNAVHRLDLCTSHAIEVVGTQEYRFADTFLCHFEKAYGTEAAADIAPHLSPICGCDAFTLALHHPERWLVRFGDSVSER